MDMFKDISRKHIEKTLNNVANRYIGENQPHPFVFRTYQREGIRGTEQYDYNFNFNERFPETKDGEIVYACAKVWMDHPLGVTLRMNCFCPAVVYVNGKVVYRSTSDVEISKKRVADFVVQLEIGWAHFTVQFTKRASGFGGEFGPIWAKWNYLPFLSPGMERIGHLGWIFTEPLDRPLEQLPCEGWSEIQSEAVWLPHMRWSEEQLSVGQLNRIFGMQSDHYAVGWSKIWFSQMGEALYILRGKSEGKITINIGGKQIYASENAGAFEVTIKEHAGIKDIVVKSFCGVRDWGFEIGIRFRDKKLNFIPGEDIQGNPDSWLYLGPFPVEEEVEINSIITMYDLFGTRNHPKYWRSDLRETWIRPSLENPLFAKWNYPLGVTLYGLLQTGRKLGRSDIISYARRHIEECSSMFEYTLWEKEHYGLPGINHQLSQIDTLDDCGSLGSTLLEACRDGELSGAREVADKIANYITSIQSRLSDGTLYRTFSDSETLWADDLYMSVPFLCRYYQLTGNLNYLNDAAKQFTLFKRYLYMPECKLFSHVYDFLYDTQTKIPWGRGNGWVLFSLSEILAVLPQDHSERTDLLSFYHEFSEGVLQYQGKNGLWHQVLFDWDSYEETSCTAMFIYALSRGIRYGWIEPKDEYILSIYKAWSGIERLSIDRQGNVHGVCRGSWYSFNPDYYKYDLQPLLNDTHGIGIVLLAGVEVIKLQEWMEAEKA